MSRRSKTVASQLVHGMMRIAAFAGVGHAEFTRSTGVTEEEARDPLERIGRAKYERVLALLESVRERPSTDPPGMVWLTEGFPLLAAACLNAVSARGAIETYVTYRPLMDESNALRVREREGLMQLEYVADDPLHHAAVEAAGNFDLLAQIIRAYDVGPPTRFSARLQASSPALARRLSSQLRGAVQVDCAENVLHFSTARLDDRFPHHNPLLRRILEQKLDQELADLARHASLALTVERALHRALAGHHGTEARSVLDQVCAELRVTRWTLRRRLAGEGQSFKDLHARVKLQLARRLLEESSLSIGEVSDQLGFTSANSFARFFRKELGIPPQQYRQRAPPEAWREIATLSSAGAEPVHSVAH